MPALLEVRHLSLTIQTQNEDLPILKDISFEVAKGKTLALVGESGSGKSLTALAIMQLLPPTAKINPASEILLQGHDLLTYSETKMRTIRGRKIALVFQEAATALNPVLTINEQIGEVLSTHFNLTRKEKQSRIAALLHEVGMPDADYNNIFPHQLSGGLKQRAMIAMALAGEPDVLIADEPTTALDVTLQAQILDLLRKLQQKRNMGLIFITHDLGVVYQIADHVAVLYKGEVVESAPLQDFFAAPRDDYSRKLFASIPGWLTAPERVHQDDSHELLRVDNLKVYYPIKKGLFKRTIGYVKAVDDISFNLKAGRTLALVGESGSGKTTTGMAILRLAPITAGELFFQQQNLATLHGSDLRKIRSDLQVVLQDPYSSMNPRMLIGDIVAEGMRLTRISRTERDKKVAELLNCVGISSDAKDRYPHEFSGGQRQRICIARALAVEPKLLICDEPTSALDVSAQMQVLNLLLDLQKEFGLSYLLITHNIAVVEYMADEIAVMHRGKIVELGDKDAILNHPQNDYTQKLLTAVPTIPKNLLLADSNHKE